VCEADLLVPLFWERRFFIKLGFLIPAAILQTLLVLGSVGSFLRTIRNGNSPVVAFSRIVVAGGLVFALAAILAATLGHFFGAQSGGVGQAGRDGSQLAADRAVEQVYLAVFVIFLGMTHLNSATEALTRRQKRRYPVLFLAVCLAGIYLINNVLPLINLTWKEFAFPDLFPIYEPIGMDFRKGLYLPAQRLLSGSPLYPLDRANSPNLYPPMVVLLGLPYTALPEEQAYVAHVSLLFIFNLACLALAALLVRRRRDASAIAGSGPTENMAFTVLILVALSLVSSYPFFFSIERGNIDVFAMVLSLACFVVLLRSPSRIWWQVILLSLAIHIKVYPVFLLTVLFLVHGFRLAWPMLVVNAALLLCLGPVNTMGFIESILRLYHPVLWVGNHSGHAFGALTAGSLHATKTAMRLLQAAFAALPLLVWFFGILAAKRLPTREGTVVAGVMITTPLMAVIPSLAHDYQLVIIYSAIFLLIAQICIRMVAHQRPSDYVQLLLVSVATLFIGRSYMLMSSMSPLLRNKYPWLLLLEAVMLVHILQQRHDARAATTEVASPA